MSPSARWTTRRWKRRAGLVGDGARNRDSIPWAAISEPWHEPFPALAIDRHRNLVSANRIAMHLLAGVDAALLAELQAYRAPDGMSFRPGHAAPEALRRLTAG